MQRIECTRRFLQCALTRHEEPLRRVGGRCAQAHEIAEHPGELPRGFARRSDAGGGRRENWRRVRDSNPRYVAVYLISSQAPSTTRPTLREPRIIPALAKRPQKPPQRTPPAPRTQAIEIGNENGGRCPRPAATGARVLPGARPPYFLAAAGAALGAAGADTGGICAAGTDLPFAFISAK